jgi:hypothetical protein
VCVSQTQPQTALKSGSIKTSGMLESDESIE